MIKRKRMYIYKKLQYNIQHNIVSSTIYHVRFVYLLTRSTWTLSDVTMMRPQKWCRIMSTNCQTNASLITGTWKAWVTTRNDTCLYITLNIYLYLTVSIDNYPGFISNCHPSIPDACGLIKDYVPCQRYQTGYFDH